jgi:hypothetical protein
VALVYIAAGEELVGLLPVSEQLVITIDEGGADNDGVVHLFFR